MTTTTATAHLVVVRVGNSGRAFHRAVKGVNESGVAYAYTACGAERRHVGVGALHQLPDGVEVTCRACQGSAPQVAATLTAATPAPAPAPAAPAPALWDGLTRREWLLQRADALEAAGKPELAAEARADAELA